MSYNHAVKPKKHLGQHFLKDQQIAADIASVFGDIPVTTVLEIGPGMGVLTRFLLKLYGERVAVAEIDTESVAYLRSHFPELSGRIWELDFLGMDLHSKFDPDMAIIGNFPYNISSQIVFKVIENRTMVSHFGGMFQKEVAERLTAKPRTKSYGILSVLLGAFYDVEYLFTVPEHVFNPPPKVKSGVMKAVRKQDISLGCDTALFFEVVKTGFGQRRKMLSNALGKFNIPKQVFDTTEFAKLRAEELDVAAFVALTNFVSQHRQ